MSFTMKIRKVTSLPGTFEPSTLYLVQSADAGLMEIYVSSSDGATARHVISKSEITSMITSALAGFDTAQLVADIAARDALSPTTITEVLVIDATADPTVDAGAATYIYDPNTSTWIKISEAESMDVVLQWANIVGRPTSLVADIDDAVSKRHTHANKAVLDDINADINENLTYKGQQIRAYMDEEAW